MSADDEKAAPDIPPLPVELEEPMTPVSGEVTGEELPPLPDEMEKKASPAGGKTSGEELPPLPSGMTKDAVAAGPAPVPRPQSITGSTVPQSTPYPQAQKPRGKGAMIVLILALIACALYQGVQAWQAKQTETEAKEKMQQNAAAEAKATQQAEDKQARANHIAGLVKSKREEERKLGDIKARRDEFREKQDAKMKRLEEREESARYALKTAERRKSELEEQLKGSRHD